MVTRMGANGRGSGREPESRRSFAGREDRAALPAASSPQQTASRSATTSWLVPAIACLVWLALWYLTPGLLDDGVGSRFSADWDVAILIECGIAVVVVAILLATHRRFNRVLFARSSLMWLYILPAGLAIALPFHYSLEAPVVIYLIWMTISVFWQDYLTFGLLQSYVRERLPGWATIAVVSVMFWVGHAVFIPHRFGLDNMIPSLAMVGLGAVLALLRARLGTLHLLLALHLAFYFIFA